MDKVSIITPAYNCEKFLKHTINSVIAQTYQNWEMIIVDDNSSDNTFNEAQLYAKKDSRIRVLQNEANSGVSISRNVGISQAAGRYIAFLDADDLWREDKLARQVFFMKKNDAALSHTSYAFMSEKGFVMPVGRVNVDEKVDLPHYMKTTQIGLSTAMLDTQKLGKPQFEHDRKLCEDARLWMGYFRQGFVSHGLDDVLSLYRVRGNQISGNKLKMASNTFQRYWNEKGLAAHKRMYYWVKYAINATSKRLKNNKELDKNIVMGFNCNKR